jgi:hypothetical protein
VTRRTPKYEQTRSGVGDSYERTLAGDPARDATLDSRTLLPKRPSARAVGDKIGRSTILAVLGPTGNAAQIRGWSVATPPACGGAERLIREAQALAKRTDPRRHDLRRRRDRRPRIPRDAARRGETLAQALGETELAPI